MPDDGGEQLAFEWAPQHPTPGSVEPLPTAAPLADRLRRLARQGVYLGTSSWKYPGWRGQVYDPARYQVRGKFSERKFNQECLAEYAAVFPTVCGDFAFYQFPSAGMWERIFAQLPGGYAFSLKVPEEVTVERFPDVPRYGKRAGTVNGHFLDAALVCDQLLAPLEPYLNKLGVIIFQFPVFHTPPTGKLQPFGERLGCMLDRLPTDRFRFAVEVRDPAFVAPGSDYLACLHDHKVAHCLNSWTRMPPVAEQMRVPGVFTAEHVVARFLLRPGRAYQQAVEQFEPYEQIRDPYPEGRDALSELIEACVAGERTLYGFVNNRFEGNAIETIKLTTEHA